jgi:hypothetical protein
MHDYTVTVEVGVSEQNIRTPTWSSRAMNWPAAA